MNRTAVVAGFAAGLALLAAVAAGGATTATTQADAGANASFGAEVSSFMQASSAETEGEIDDGMFAAAMNRTDDPEERRRLIEQRQEALTERQQRLQRRQERLAEAGPLERYAIATELAVGAAELEQSVARTERAAEDVGMNTSALAEIRTNASEMRGMAVAGNAGGVGVPSNGERWPPEGVPGDDGPSNGSAPGDRPEEAGNESKAGPGGDDGPPDDTGDGGESKGNDNPPEDTGNGGQSDDTGNGGQSGGSS